mmetsp:Transcript_22251/g.44397  ORF Transcript_22251/g.44397 Transcript_22251/m.44397 type:complete len:103 (-) Transcript_22251:486-794(-)
MVGFPRNEPLKEFLGLLVDPVLALNVDDGVDPGVERESLEAELPDELLAPRSNEESMSSISLSLTMSTRLLSSVRYFRILAKLGLLLESCSQQSLMSWTKLG